MLGIRARDDKIATYDPSLEFLSNNNTFLIETTSGGHVAWIEGLFKLSFWYPRPCIEFIKYCLSQNNFKDELKK